MYTLKRWFSWYEWETEEGRVNLAFFYPILFVLFVINISVPVREDFRISDLQQSYEFEKIPAQPLDVLKYQNERLRNAMKEGPGDQPKEYFQILDKQQALESALLKFERTQPHPDVSLLITVRLLTNYNRNMGLRELQQAYWQQFGRERMAETGKALRTNNLAMNENLVSEDPISKLSSWPYWKAAYGNLFIVMLTFFIVRLHQKGASILVESWRIPFAALLWPITMWFYPTVVDPRKQIRQAIMFASYALSAFLSFAPAAFAGQGAKTQKNGKDTSAFILDAEGHIGIEILPGSTDDELSPGYVSPWLSSKLTTTAGSLSTFAFADVGARDPFLSARFEIAPPESTKLSFLSGAVEIGKSGGGEFVQAGPGWNLSSTPLLGSVVRKVFPFLKTWYFDRVSGVRVPREVLVAWQSCELPLVSGWSIFTDGFWRIREDSNLNFGQPGFWLKHIRAPNIMFGTEVECAGKDCNPLFGLKLAF